MFLFGELSDLPQALEVLAHLLGLQVPLCEFLVQLCDQKTIVCFQLFLQAFVLLEVIIKEEKIPIEEVSGVENAYMGHQLALKMLGLKYFNGFFLGKVGSL